MTSTPPLTQFFSAVTAGIGPLVAQFAVAVAVTVDSLEPARICVWLSACLPTPVKTRPTGTLVAAWTDSDAVPSSAPCGTSKKTSSPFLTEVTSWPSLPTTFTPALAASEPGVTVALSALVRTVIGPSFSPDLPETAGGSSTSEEAGSARFLAFSSR